MLRAYKYFLRPTADQHIALDGIRRLCCELYNAGLQERRDAWHTSKKSISFKQQSAQLPSVRSERPDANTVYAQVLQDVLRRLNKTFSGFFRRVKAGQKPGYPRFRSARRYDSFTFPQLSRSNRSSELSAGGVELLPNGRLRVHDVPGEVKVKWHRPWLGRSKTATFKREGARWYLVLTCEQDALVDPLSETGLTAGIDVGLTDFATLDVARGAVALPAAEQPASIANPRHLRAAAESLTRAQQRMTHRRRGSARRATARALFAKQHAHVANARRDFHHKLALDLVRRFDRIAVEKLDIKGMLSEEKDEEATARSKKQRRGLRRSIGDAGWGQFLSILAYKAESAGREFREPNARGTTKECSGCGAMVPKELWERMHRCPCCSLVMPRDRNAARNIRQRAYGREAAIGEGGLCAA